MIIWLGAGLVFVVAMGLSYASGRSSAHDAMLEAVSKRSDRIRCVVTF
jgi:hypothetical protein